MDNAALFDQPAGRLTPAARLEHEIPVTAEAAELIERFRFLAGKRESVAWEFSALGGVFMRQRFGLFMVESASVWRISPYLIC